MEQAKQSGEEGNGLTESDFERLKQMHKMTPAERKVYIQYCYIKDYQDSIGTFLQFV